MGSGPCCDGTYLGQQIEPNHGQDETVRYRLEDLKSRQGGRAAAIEPIHGSSPGGARMGCLRKNVSMTCTVSPHYRQTKVGRSVAPPVAAAMVGGGALSSVRTLARCSQRPASAIKPYETLGRSLPWQHSSHSHLAKSG